MCSVWVIPRPGNYPKRNTLHLERGESLKTVGCMRIACWIPKFTNTHSEYVILNAFPLPQRLHVRASMLRFTCTSCVVLANVDLRAVLPREKLHIMHFSQAFMEIIKKCV